MKNLIVSENKALIFNFLKKKQQQQKKLKKNILKIYFHDQKRLKSLLSNFARRSYFR